MLGYWFFILHLMDENSDNIIQSQDGEMFQFWRYCENICISLIVIHETFPCNFELEMQSCQDLVYYPPINKNSRS